MKMANISITAFFLFSLVYKVRSDCEHDLNDFHYPRHGGTTALSGLQYFIGQRIYAYKATYDADTTAMSETPSRDLSQAANSTVRRIANNTVACPDTPVQYHWYDVNEPANPATATPCCPEDIMTGSECVNIHMGIYIPLDNGDNTLVEATDINYIVSEPYEVAFTPGNIEAAVDALITQPHFETKIMVNNAQWGAFAGQSDAVGGGTGKYYISFTTGTVNPATGYRACGEVLTGDVIPSSSPITTTTTTATTTTAATTMSSSTGSGAMSSVEIHSGYVVMLTAGITAMAV